MRIEKYVKDRDNKYKVTIDGEVYTLYDDVIIKYALLMKSEIEKTLFDEIITLNDELKSYYDSIKYITKKLRSEKEIYEFLKKREIDESIIKKTINRLKNNNFLNEDLYLKSYINDQVNLSNNGPKKIKSNLIKLGIDEEKIDEYLNNIDKSIWQDRIDNYIEKKIRVNHSSSSYMLKVKLQKDLINLGYDREMIIPSITRCDIIDTDIYKRELEKAKRELSKKYSGYELEQKIKMRLYRKGFKISSIEESNYEE